MARAERDLERETGLGTPRELQRLNTPGRRARLVLPRRRWDRDAFGKFAEGFARFMGTARFLGGMTVVILVWVLWNVPYGRVLRGIRYSPLDVVRAAPSFAQYVAGRLVLPPGSGESAVFVVERSGKA